MTYTPPEGRSAILLDAENILIPAFKDEALKGRKKQLVIKAVALALEGVAERMGSLTYQFAAVSLPPSGRLRDEAWSMIKDLVDSGYQVTTESMSPNASDLLIEKKGIALAKELDIDSIVLATRDGKEPYPGLLDALSCAKKKVCVAAYDYFPASFRARSDLQYALLGGDVRKFVARMESWQEAQIYEKSLNYRESERELFLRKGIALALEALLRDCQSDRYIPASFGFIVRYLSNNLLTSFGIDATNDEVKRVIRHLITYTDVFENVTRYIFNPRSVLLAQAKAEGGEPC